MRSLFKSLLFLFFIGCTSLSYAQTIRISCPEFTQFYSKDSINIVTFGASTVQGVNGMNFQEPLTKNFKNCYKNKVVNIENFGIGGETTGQCLRRLEDAIDNKTGFIVIIAGANDAIQLETGKLTIKETEANMRKIIVSSLNQQLTPIICTIQNFDDRTDERLKRVNRQIARINYLYKKLANEYHIALSDLNWVIKRDFSLYQDFVHPNAKGYRLIAFALYETINKVIAEKFLKAPTSSIGYPDLSLEFPSFSVSQNYPNPTKNGYSSIDIIMPQIDQLSIEVYNIHGKLVSTINTEELKIGKHVLKIDLSQQPAGIYIYRVKSLSGRYTDTKKLIRSY